MANETKNIGAKAVGDVFDVPLELMGTYNVRAVLPRCEVPYENLLKMAVGTPEQRAEFIRIVEEHEAETQRLDPKGHTILELASSIFDHKQLQPITVRQTGTKDYRDPLTGEKTGDKCYGYQIIMGGRRTLAVAYLHANDMSPSGPYVKGTLVKADKDKALDLSIAENLHRKGFNDYEMGEIVAHFREREDNPLTWAQIAEKLRKGEQFLRDCYALARPDESAPADLQEQLAAGTITKGEAVALAKGKPRKGLGDGGTRLTSGPVRKAIAVKEIEAKIDDALSAGDTPDEGTVIRVTALAECLGSTYDAEVALSNDRREKARLKAEAERLKAEAEKAKAEAKAAADKAKGHGKSEAA